MLQGMLLLLMKKQLCKIRDINSEIFGQFDGVG
jgi:hypothetical protein